MLEACNAFALSLMDSPVRGIFDEFGLHETALRHLRSKAAMTSSTRRDPGWPNRGGIHRLGGKYY